MKNVLELLNYHHQYQKSQHALDAKPLAKPEIELNQSASREPHKTHYVFFKDIAPRTSITNRAASALSTAEIDTTPSDVYGAINGFSIPLTPQQADALRRSPGISSVEADKPLPLSPPVEVKPIDPVKRSSANELNQAIELEDVWLDRNTNPKGQNLQADKGIETSALPSYGNDKASSGEVLPYGVKAVWGGVDVSTKGNVGTGTYAFVIDSGVLNTTDDLNINTAWSKSWVNGESAFTDGDGHGTHVAGTIAALANGKGVVGVAPGAEVISLKVFDSNGGGASYSTIIDAINYATEVINTNGLDKSKVVINMSLGGGFSYGLDTAVKNAANQGIQFAIAAGNSGDDADHYSPASAGDHKNVYTVSAVDNVYQMPWWSNWDDQNGGDDVDVAAPGVDVYSYYKDGQLASLSGTSMAAPHVAGLLLMGGVQQGDMVKAASGGAADPFALIQSDTETPSDPQPDPDPTPPPNDDEHLYLGAATGGSTINISNQSGSLQQSNLETQLGLDKGVLDTSLSGTKKAVNATEGSAFQATGNGKAGDSITFSFNFQSTDYLPYADYAFYAINNEVYSLAEVGVDTKNGGSKNGSFTYTLSEKDFEKKDSESFKISLGVVDAIDNSYDSLLSINTFTINRATNSNEGQSILGSSGSDLMVGGDLNDTFNGYAGNDTINGGSGSDSAQFSSRSNSINLSSTSWQNTGDGTDRLISIENINAGSGNDRITGNSSNNTLNGENDDDWIYGDLGNDTINGGSGSDSAQFSSRSNSINLSNTNWQNTGDGTDRLISIENINAGSGNDRITGNSSNNTLNGENDDDWIYGDLGNDTINGGAGSDSAQFSSRSNSINLSSTNWQNTGDGTDRLISIENINAGSGNDRITGNSSNNTLNGENDDDWIYGDLGNDTINGGSGSDSAQFSSRSNSINLSSTSWQNTGDGTDRLISIENINAGSGNDRITGNSSNNTLNGENDDDWIYGDLGNDTINGGAGSDSAQFSSRSNSINLSNTNWQNTGDGTDRLISIENINAGSGNDRITGNSSNNTLNGENDDDWIYGDLGNDTINGGAGSDSAQFSSRSNSINLSSTSWQNTGDGTDRLISIENINAGSGNDRITGNSSNNTLIGENDDDWIYGDLGNDTINGGSGSDSAQFSSRSNSINLSNTNWQNTGDGTDRLISIENINAGSGNDRITGNSSNNTLNGENDDDWIYGDLGNDTINGGAGSDSAQFSSRSNSINLSNTNWQNTGDGTDRLISIENINAGSGNDRITGNSSNNTLNGENDDDWIYGDLGNDTINGGSGSDSAQFSSRSNSINLSSTSWQNTGDGTDRLISIENINAGSGNDRIKGNRAANTLNGQTGKDRLFGGGGNDRLYGGSGKDLLIGGGGKDLLWGQAGRDTFQIKRGTGYSIIKDFSDGADRIQLGSGRSGLKLKTRGDDVFVYQRRDLVAIVEDASGDLQQRNGKYLV